MTERILTINDARIELQKSANGAKKYIDAQRNGIFCEDGFQGISVEELHQLGEAILDAPDVEHAYDLMAQMTSTGDGNYYDRLIGEPQHLTTYKTSG